MATEVGALRAGAEALAPERVRELAAWTPRFGVVSVCFDAVPGDRSEGWRIELRDRLRALKPPPDADDRHRRRSALDAVVERILGRFPGDAPPPGGRTQLGYVAVGDDGGDRWFTSHVPVERFDVILGDRPLLAPLVELAERARPLAIAVVSSERIRVLDFAAGRIEAAAAFELETFEPTWRERKSQRPADPARLHGASSSGKDQYGQRLDANRDRFVKQAGAETGAWAADRDRHELLVIGDRALAEAFAGSAGDGLDVRCIDDADLVSAPAHQIGGRVVEALPAIDRARQQAFVARVLDAARSGGRGSLGVEETAQALAEGRVERLLLDAERDLGPRPELAEPLGIPPERARDIREWMIETALATAAAVTPLRGEPAAALDEQGGAAALLRY
jgi:Bacterial archaeo-eukaryotic release factor family 5